MKNFNRGPVAVTIIAGSYGNNCAPAANEVFVGNFTVLENSLITIHSLLLLFINMFNQEDMQLSRVLLIFSSALHTIP